MSVAQWLNKDLWHESIQNKGM